MATRRSSSGSSTRDGFDASTRIVLLRGPDSFLRRMHTRTLAEVLTDAFGEIAEFVFDGSETEPAVVLDELRSYGLLHPHKLVIVDQADQFLAAPKEQAADAPGPATVSKHGRRTGPRTTRALLEAYAAAPVDNATLLLRAETWRPGKLDKLIEKVGRIVKCDAPSAGAAATWCRRRCPKEHACEISPEAAAILVDRVGTSLARLDMELAKLSAYVGANGPIDEDAVRTMVGLSREEQAWEIQSALVSGSPGAALGKMRELLGVSRQPEVLMFWAMADLVKKVHAACHLLRRGVAPGAAAKELRLWGPSMEPIVRAARRRTPDELAQLLRDIVDRDRDTKRGFGKASRTLEGLAVRIADTMGRT